MASADRMQAQMTREQFRDLHNRLLPILDRQYKELDDSGMVSRRGMLARNNVTQATNAQRQTMRSTMLPMRRSLKGDQKEALDRTLQTGGMKNAASAANNARTRAKDEIMGARMDALGIEQGLADNASNAMSEAASLQSQRQQQNRANRAQAKQQKYSLIGTGLGLMGMFMLSDKTKKTAIKPADSKAIDRELDQIKIKQFHWKPEMGVDGEFVGPLAQELPPMFRGPDGKSLNAYNTLGAMVDRQQRMEKRLKQLEGSNG